MYITIKEERAANLSMIQFIPFGCAPSKLVEETDPILERGEVWRVVTIVAKFWITATGSFNRFRFALRENYFARASRFFLYIS